MTRFISQELLDVVDENDQFVEVKTRGEIHTQGLMHRAVHILVFNHLGDLFLQKRSLQKDNNPGLWDSSAAGHVDSGEDYRACAMRELSEELGIIIENLVPLFRLSPTTATGMEHCTVYRCQHNGPFTLKADEIDEGQWIPPHTMDQKVAAHDPTMTEVLQIIWKKYRQETSR